MEISILDSNKKAGTLSFVLKDSTPAFANTLRRVVVELVPTMAIEDVEIRKNSSVLYDEIIAHRLGLLALKTDLKTYNLSSECKCDGEGCARCSVKMTLKAKGPKTVYAEEINSKDSKIVPVNPKTPIVKLLKNQELEFEATAILGIGKEHIKWSPGLVIYRYKPLIELTKKGQSNQELADICPKNIFKVKNKVVQLNKDDILNCDLCEACVDKFPDSIKLNEKDDEFIFYVESFGQLSCQDIIKEACSQLDGQLDKFIKLVKEK